MSTNTPRPLPSTRESLPIALIRARERIMVPIRTMLAQAGISEQKWRILRVLDEFGPQEATELARRAAILLPSQTRIVNALIQAELVTRCIGPSDRRKQVVQITPKGRQIIQENLTEAQRINAGIETYLGTQELEQLLTTLQKLARFDMPADPGTS